jgi:hypothetical protein
MQAKAKQQSNINLSKKYNRTKCHLSTSQQPLQFSTSVLGTLDVVDFMSRNTILSVLAGN